MTDAVYDGTSTRGFSYDGTVAQGGVAQILWEGYSPPRGWACYNPSSTDWLWVSSTTEAAPNKAGCIGVAPLGGYETPGQYRPVGYVSIYGAVTGQPITARGW